MLAKYWVFEGLLRIEQASDESSERLTRSKRGVQSTKHSQYLIAHKTKNGLLRGCVEQGGYGDTMSCI